MNRCYCALAEGAYTVTGNCQLAHKSMMSVFFQVVCVSAALNFIVGEFLLNVFRLLYSCSYVLYISFQMCSVLFKVCSVFFQMCSVCFQMFSILFQMCSVCFQMCSVFLQIELYFLQMCSV